MSALDDFFEMHKGPFKMAVDNESIWFMDASGDVVDSDHLLTLLNELWNSISMGWRPAETAPKDGTMIQATMRTAMLVHALWVKGPSDPGEGEGPGWFCPESGVEYWESDLLGWRSIPPLPEVKP